MSGGFARQQCFAILLQPLLEAASKIRCPGASSLMAIYVNRFRASSPKWLFKTNFFEAPLD
jgi:hypothetical protein